MRGTGVQILLQKEKERKLAKQAQGEKQIEKKRGEMEKNREDTNTKGVEFERSCVGGKRSNQTHNHGCSTYNL